MQHHRQYGPLDDSPDIVGDSGFTRLDMLTDPAMLEPGSLAASENVRFDANGTTVRAGVARQFPPGTSIGTIYRAGVYKPSMADDAFAFPTANNLVIFYPQNQTFQYINYPQGETVGSGDQVDLVQAGVGAGTLPGLYILRGLQKWPLKYDPTLGTVAVAATMPPANFALFYQDRFALATDNTGSGLAQAVSCSDFLDFTIFKTLNQFNILQGGDDYLTCFLAYQNDYVLIASRKRWLLAYFDPNVANGGYTGNLSDSSFLRQLTNEAGAVGPKAAIQALGKIWFITDDAIYAFTPQLDNNLTVLGRPVSAEIQPIMDRFSSKFASHACIEHWGYRLYFAMPISDPPVTVTAATVTLKTTSGLLLPFTLPAMLSSTAIAQYTTATPHNLKVNDYVLVAGLPTLGYNGQFSVLSVVDAYNFTVPVATYIVTPVGTNVTATRLATRNNTIAVYNLKTDGWESIDTLPAGYYADWLLSADYGTRKRLWCVDAISGPALYEEAEGDEIGTVVGSLPLPFTIPAQLQEAQFATVPTPGRILTRAMRWTNYLSNPTASAYPRKVRGCETRATMAPTDQVTMNLLVRTPNNRVWTGTRNFIGSQFETADVPLRKICGVRALEAQVELISTNGRPTFRSILVDTVNLGKVEE